MDVLWAELVWVFLVFLAGIAAGSFINVIVGRLPLEKSILWPNSHCLTCLNPLYLKDNLPIIGWLIRRGKCRFCGTKFSSRYMWVELTTGVAFAALYYFEVLHNWHRIPFFDQAKAQLGQGLTSWQGWVFWVHHAVLFALLFSAALCDWDHKMIPISLTVTGTIVGLVSAVLFPWPFPNDPSIVSQISLQVDPNYSGWAFGLNPENLSRGLYPWPVWGPLPDWLANHRWLLGLLTGLAGAAAGMTLIRSVKFLFEKGLGKEALGLGDADLMMMAGAFLGWQVILVSFFMGALVTLPFAILMRLAQGGKNLPQDAKLLPFGPGLAAGIVVTWLWWPKLGPALQSFFFEDTLLSVAGVILAAGMFVASIVLRVFGFGK